MCVLQYWEKNKLGILYFCLEKKKSYFYSYFLSQPKLHHYTLFQVSEEVISNYVPKGERIRILDVYSSNDYYHDETNY